MPIRVQQISNMRASELNMIFYATIYVHTCSVNGSTSIDVYWSALCKLSSSFLLACYTLCYVQLSGQLQSYTFYVHAYKILGWKVIYTFVVLLKDIHRKSARNSHGKKHGNYTQCTSVYHPSGVTI